MWYIFGWNGLVGRALVRQLELRKREFRIVDRGGLGGSSLKPEDAVIDLMCDGSPDQWTADRLKDSTEHSRQLVLSTLISKSHLFFASSSEVYDLMPFHGSLRCRYRAGKRAIEDYARAMGSTATLGRLFNIYGSDWDVPDGRVVPVFLRAALKGEPIPVHGNGLQERSFCWVDDLCEAIIRCCDKRVSGTLDLGREEVVTIENLAEYCRRAVGYSKSETHYMGHQLADRIGTQHRCPNIEPAHSLIDWTATTSLEEGLKLSLELGGDR